MPVENALGFLRIVDIAKALPAAILIAGPHPFLREYIVDAIARRLTREGLQYRTFQIANASDFASVVEELRAPDLFAPKRMLVCRVMRSFRDRGGDESTPADDSSEKETRGGDVGLIGAVTDVRPPNHLVIVYDKDAAPAKIRRAAESVGILVNCLRPFDNQLPQYAARFRARLRLEAFAKRRRAAYRASWRRSCGDCQRAQQARDSSGEGRIDRGGRSDGAGALEAARAIRNRREPVGGENFGDAGATHARACRRTRSVRAARRRVHSGDAAHDAGGLDARCPQEHFDIAGALGFGPSSPLATRAIDGAKRFGLARLQRAYRRASQLDVDFKNGEIKDRAEALSALVLDLTFAVGEKRKRRPKGRRDHQNSMLGLLGFRRVGFMELCGETADLAAGGIAMKLALARGLVERSDSGAQFFLRCGGIGGRDRLGSRP